MLCVISDRVKYVQWMITCVFRILLEAETFEAEAALERCRAEVFRRDQQRCEAELLCIESKLFELQCHVAVEERIQEVEKLGR